MSALDSHDEVHAEKGLALKGTADLERIEAPVTIKAYLLCAFASFGGVRPLPGRLRTASHC